MNLTLELFRIFSDDPICSIICGLLQLLVRCIVPNKSISDANEQNNLLNSEYNPIVAPPEPYFTNNIVNIL